MKRIFSILLLIFFSFSVQGSHLMGGEITWECIKDPASPNIGQYIFTMKVYRDCNGITVSTISQNLTVWGHPSVTGITVDFVSQTDVSPQCDPINSGNAIFSCANGDLGAVEEYVFQSQPVSLPGAPTPAGWHFSWSSCCRNIAIVNLLNSSEGFTLRASMYPYMDPVTGIQVPADPCFDSSPNFKEQPKTILCTGFPFSYSHNASDEELDSLVYSWGDPLDDDVFSGPIFNPGTTPSILTFAPPYSTNSPLPGAPTLDASTGEISYNASTAGFFVTCVKIEAFKCGQLVSEIFREVQVVLVDCSSYPFQPVSGINSPPSISAPFTDPITGLPSFETTVYAGDLVTFNIQGDDPDVYINGNPQDLTLEVSGGQFSDNYLPSGNCLNPPCATFDNGLGLTPPFSAPALVSGEFRWQTSCNHIAAIAGCGSTSNVFTFLIKVHDDFCPAFGITIATIKVTVVPAPIDQSPDPRCVSVNSNGDVDVTWEFLGSEQSSTVYEIFHSSNILGPYTLLDSVTYPTNTYTHIGADADLQTQYYYLRSHSECAADSDPSDTLQTIDLDVTAINGGTQGDLNWNPIHIPDLSTSANYYHIHALTGGVWTLTDSSVTTSSIFDARTCNSFQSLMVSLEDQSGCVSNSSIDGAVLTDTISPSIPVISDISVDATGKAVISWTSSSPDVDLFAIYWQDPQGAWITIDSVSGSNTSYIFNNSNAQLNSESYRIRALDSCGNQSSTSLIHNSINLISSIDVCAYTLNFNWNGYINFTGGISHYKLFLVEEDIGGNITNNVVQRFNSTNIDFIFSGIQQDYTYSIYIEAYNVDSTLVARSDQENITIDLPTKPKYNYLEYVSVLHSSNDFGSVDISCLIDNQALIDHYLVFRSLRDQSDFKQIATIPFPTNNADKITYIDKTAATDDDFYEYQIYPVDTCGAISVTGSEYHPILGSTNDTSFGRTMLVEVFTNLSYGESFPDSVAYTNPFEWSHLGEGRVSNQFTNTISFNEYEKFNATENVAEYRLYRSISDDNSFNTVTPIYIFNRVDNPNEPLTYIDVVTSFGNTNGNFCYYVEAVEGHSTNYIPMLSGVVSNINCIYQTPKLFIPNTFTPDGNGPIENEIFLPVTNFVSEIGYSFMIYNRIGTEIFKTSDPKKGWDGNYLGTPVPNGNYIYHVKYINGFGSLTDNTGTVLIIR
ncbi:MAG: gliding motility-associated C-terminal domain-containing protein [Bacteroidota bacterium]|nr:gliding motility-associated C-terminal domain-containing protein [Bacteroidota bacterium]